jgi:acyl-CoA thioesterase II
MAEDLPKNYWTQILAIKQTSPQTFTTIQNPQRMGNALPIAYGGFALAAAVKSACLTLPPPSASQPEYHLYSISGHYLGPARIDRPLITTVRTLRQTRTFCTRYLEVSQTQDDGTSRNVLVALADFQVAEPESMLEYHAPPTKKYSHYTTLDDGPTQSQRKADEGKVSQKLVDIQSASFGLLKKLFEMRPCPEGIFSQVLTGVAKHLPTTQDHLPLTQRSTADWNRGREKLASQTENVALLAFLMDGAVAFAPLTFSHLFLDDSGATSSLDFALRVFSNEVKMEEWHLREITTSVGSAGRTYSEARMWDAEGRCVASMTQQSICRPKVKKDGKGKDPEKGKL